MTRSTFADCPTPHEESLPRFRSFSFHFSPFLPHGPLQDDLESLERIFSPFSPSPPTVSLACKQHFARRDAPRLWSRASQASKEEGAHLRICMPHPFISTTKCNIARHVSKSPPAPSSLSLFLSHSAWNGTTNDPSLPIVRSLVASRKGAPVSECILPPISETHRRTRRAGR